jgi:Glycosyltransferase like family
MALTDRVTFIVTVLDWQVLTQNLLASPALSGSHNHQILVQEGFASAGQAYNDGLHRAANELLIFTHSDMFLPKTWMSQLERALQYLEKSNPNWGVLGCWGATKSGEYRGHIYSTGWGVLGKPFDHPQPVQTLDEIILIFRRSSALQFDEELPHFHFYGTDICMRAAMQGMKSYAISAFCIHNTAQTFRMVKEFYCSYSYIRRIWRDNLPIQTSCIRVSKYNVEMYRRRLEEAYRHLLRLDRSVGPRVSDPSRILQEMKVS